MWRFSTDKCVTTNSPSEHISLHSTVARLADYRDTSGDIAGPRELYSYRNNKSLC